MLQEEFFEKVKFEKFKFEKSKHPEIIKMYMRAHDIQQKSYMYLFACWVILHAFVVVNVVCYFFKKFSECHNSLGTDKDQNFISPFLGPNCLQTCYQQTT